MLHQPGTRIGGPIVDPGHLERPQQGVLLLQLRRVAVARREHREPHASCTRAPSRAVPLHGRRRRRARSTCSRSRPRTARSSTIDPTIGRLLADIRASTAGSTVVDNTDPLPQNFTYTYQTDSVTTYPTGRLDFNLTDRHRLSGSMTYTDLLSTPDTTNNREPNFPGFPDTGSQDSDRYITRGTLRSTLGANLVNEFTVGGTGGATQFSPRDRRRRSSPAPRSPIRPASSSTSTTVGGITNAASTGAYSGARGVDQGHREHAELAARARTTSRPAARSRRRTSGSRTSSTCRRSTSASTPATRRARCSRRRTSPARRPRSLTDARDLLRGADRPRERRSPASAPRRDTDEYAYLGLGTQRARLRDYGFFVADTWRVQADLTLNLGLRYELQPPFYPLNNSYSTATIDDVCGAACRGVGNLFQPGAHDRARRRRFTAVHRRAKAPTTPTGTTSRRTSASPGRSAATAASSARSSARARATACCAAGYSLGYNRPGHVGLHRRDRRQPRHRR